MININLRDVEKIIAKKEKEGITFKEAAESYAAAHGVVAKNATTYERPLPCVRDEHGEIREQTVKQLLGKINEELDELKEAVFRSEEYDDDVHEYSNFLHAFDLEKIAEEAADTITAITTMLEALRIDAEMRDEAQRRVNEKNRERGRL